MQQSKQYDDAKKEIRSLLLTYPNGAELDEFLKSYRELMGQRLPSRTFGYASDLIFLKSMTDVVRVDVDAYGKVHLTGQADEKSQHIKDLVSRQKITRNGQNNKKRLNRQPCRRPHVPPKINVKEEPVFLPGPLRAEILELMALFPEGASFTAFVMAYKKKYDKFLYLSKGFQTLELLIKNIKQLEVKSEGSEKKICHVKDNGEYLSLCGRDRKTPTKIGESAQGKKEFHIHKSGISDDVVEKFQKLLQKYPEGISDIHFSLLYESVNKETFDLHELGYSSILDLVDALPHVFRRILSPDDNKTWVILPAQTGSNHAKKEDTPRSKAVKDYLNRKQGIPADAASPILQYIEPSIPESVDLTQYVTVFLSAIIHPGLFWFQLKIDEVANEFNQFEDDIEYFYSTYSDNYKMHKSDIMIGATCVVQTPKDNQWYRAVIRSYPSVDEVVVLFADYGSVETVSTNNLYYVRNKYHDYPACALKAQLAGVKPADNATHWSREAAERFVELSSCELMAFIKSVDKGTYSVHLCDTTNQDIDIHLADTLIKEGFAVLCIEDVPDVNSNDFQNNIENSLISNEFKIDSGFDNSSRSDKSDTISEPDVSPVERKLSFNSEDVQYNGISPKNSTCGDEPNVETSPCIERQKSKRYIKCLPLCKDTRMHFVKLKNELYMLCADISKLLWRDKDSKVLLDRLTYKGVTVSFVQIKKEDCTELFNQCIWYKVPEYETLRSDDSTLILYPLKSALHILNVFGHPSICYRLAIQNEMERFDPLNSIWKEFNPEECCDLNDAENQFELEISNWCIYDLKYKREILKNRRFKLSMLKDVTKVADEIVEVEMQQEVINRRIKQIEAICSEYGSLKQ